MAKRSALFTQGRANGIPTASPLAWYHVGGFPPCECIPRAEGSLVVIKDLLVAILMAPVIIEQNPRPCPPSLLLSVLDPSPGGRKEGEPTGPGVPRRSGVAAGALNESETVDPPLWSPTAQGWVPRPAPPRSRAPRLARARPCAPPSRAHFGSTRLG